jgi:hypothetical protein
MIYKLKILLCLFLSSSLASPGRRELQPLVPTSEFRAFFLATAWNIDWPSSGSASPATQQQELINYLNLMQNANFNVLAIQVNCDTFLISHLESSPFPGEAGVRCPVLVPHRTVESLPYWNPRHCTQSRMGSTGFRCSGGPLQRHRGARLVEPIQVTKPSMCLQQMINVTTQGQYCRQL